ncbi:MAG: amidohydrolase family protein [Rhodopila sp.]
MRHSGTFDPGIAPTAPPGAPPGLYREPTFRAGFARLGKFGLSFEAWLYHPQLSDLVDLMRAYPDQKVVLNHFGGPLGVDSYEGSVPRSLPAGATACANWQSSQPCM